MAAVGGGEEAAHMSAQLAGLMEELAAMPPGQRPAGRLSGWGVDSQSPTCSGLRPDQMHTADHHAHVDVDGDGDAVLCTGLWSHGTPYGMAWFRPN